MEKLQIKIMAFFQYGTEALIIYLIEEFLLWSIVKFMA